MYVTRTSPDQCDANLQVVHGAIKTASLTGRPVLPENARKEIFLNVGEIYALSFDLLQELEERLANWYVYLRAVVRK